MAVASAGRRGDRLVDTRYYAAGSTSTKPSTETPTDSPTETTPRTATRTNPPPPTRNPPLQTGINDRWQHGPRMASRSSTRISLATPDGT